VQQKSPDPAKRDHEDCDVCSECQQSDRALGDADGQGKDDECCGYEVDRFAQPSQPSSTSCAYGDKPGVQLWSATRCSTQPGLSQFTSDSVNRPA
jgi:hypothetical protein